MRNFKVFNPVILVLGVCLLAGGCANRPKSAIELISDAQSTANTAQQNAAAAMAAAQKAQADAAAATRQAQEAAASAQAAQAVYQTLADELQQKAMEKQRRSASKSKPRKLTCR